MTRVLLFPPGLVILEGIGQKTGNCLISGTFGGFNDLATQKERNSPFVHLT